MRVASAERWAEAQAAERSYWDPAAYTLEAFTATLASIAEASAWLQTNARRALPEGDLVELGIGPMGMGCIQLLPQRGTTSLIGVDPLEQTPAATWPLPDMQTKLVQAFQGAYEHMVARAEATGLDGGRFGVVVLHNMLDHVQDPVAVLAEGHRLLAADGLLFLACDTISLANRLRLRLYARRRFAESLFIRAHPFHFRVAELLQLVTGAGFQVVATNRRRPALIHETAGHSYRLLLLAEKATG